MSRVWIWHRFSLLAQAFFGFSDYGEAFYFIFMPAHVFCVCHTYHLPCVFNIFWAFYYVPLLPSTTMKNHDVGSGWQAGWMNGMNEGVDARGGIPTCVRTGDISFLFFSSQSRKREREGQWMFFL